MPVHETGARAPTFFQGHPGGDAPGHRRVLRVISRALITHDPEAIWRELHALCGGLLSLGSVELAELCKGLQHVLREEGIEVFAGLWPALRAELMETLDALPADLDDDVSS